MIFLVLAICCVWLALLLQVHFLSKAASEIEDLARSLRQLQISTQAILPTQSLSQTSALSLGICDEHGVCLPNQSGKLA